MSLSRSRQQFLAYETHGDPEIHYERKGGIFISTCICIGFIICAALIAALVGIIVYYITYYTVAQKLDDFWNEAEPFGQSTSLAPDLRLPSTVVPSFYRLKIRADLNQSLFTGNSYITIHAKQKVKEIILHSKGLIIKNATLTEQIYEEVDTLKSDRTKRDAENATESITTEGATDSNIENSTEAITTTTEPEPVTIPTLQTQVTHSHVRNIQILSIRASSGDRLILTLETMLNPNVDYTLQLSFEGRISNSLTGFYKSSYKDANNDIRELAATQFEPTSARAAFPCFDEPAFKAKFEISIAHPQNISVLSNMKVAMQEPISDDPGWQWTHFERSVNMSTYLVAYVLSDFSYVETNYTGKDNKLKPIRVWTQPGLIHKANYALTITPKLLAFYEEVFGVPYALDKLDLIAIPDFSSGAMENWGLITFRETTLLFDEKEGMPGEKRGVAIDVSHELAHQWFGNLVTMKWWTDLWLNEGFATYVEYVGVNHIEPDWEMLLSFTRDKMSLLRTDSLKNTSPVSRQVIDASEISQKFDEISYAKGANLIRMLNHTISQELFLKGLAIYLEKWQYQNAEENDLWQSMSEATVNDTFLKDVSLVKFMNSWTRQAGYPVLFVRRDYTNGQVLFEQRLFTSAKTPYKSMEKQIWQIPITYASSFTPSEKWSYEPKVWLKDKSVTTKIPLNDSEALYVNIGAIGYYRVNYDQKNWELLSKALKAGNINEPIAKAQLIDDAFNLAKANLLNYSYALGLTSCVINGEDSKIVWDMLLDNMAFLKYNLKTTSGYMYFQDYVRLLIEKQLKTLNYGLSKPADDNEALLIENLLLWECMVEAPRCLNWAQSEFRNWMEHPENNSIPSYLRSLVYNIAIRHGGRKEFLFLWDVFQNSTDPAVKTLIITNLPSTRQESLITFLLEKSLTEIPKQYAATVWGADPPEGTHLTQSFFIRNFDRVYNVFTELDPFTFSNILNMVFGFIADSDELDKLKRFAMQHKERLLPMSQTLQKIVDTATLRIDWIQTYSRGINNWFENFLQEYASQNVTTTESPWSQNITIKISDNTTAST
ncbi:aminopeptidase N isoform X1 [Pieris rapae]|uniref:aminopeptidase N isoform X1 n=1 Tax=Pieris rapae TaxID=64459 RepID=UPI001E27C8A7|nr:aminopeptidase N isoform X1 [Pieris rapae]